MITSVTVAPPTFWIVNRTESVVERWARLLRQQGWSVSTVDRLEAFLSDFRTAGSALVLVDWECLPGGGASLQAIKDRSGVPVLLTAGIELGNDRIIAMLEAGADDYFPHSLQAELLLAKIRTHLRRIAPPPPPADVLKAPEGDLKLDRPKREVLIRGRGAKWTALHTLTLTETRLLALLLERPGTVLERRDIIDLLWQDDGEHILPGTVDKHVESLRRKLGKLGSRIRAVYGQGYAYRGASS
jgi:DNA-binding response OmpR family regulator